MLLSRLTGVSFTTGSGDMSGRRPTGSIEFLKGEAPAEAPKGEAGGAAPKGLLPAAPPGALLLLLAAKGLGVSAGRSIPAMVHCGLWIVVLSGVGSMVILLCMSTGSVPAPHTRRGNRNPRASQCSVNKLDSGTQCQRRTRVHGRARHKPCGFRLEGLPATTGRGFMHAPSWCPLDAQGSPTPTPCGLQHPLGDSLAVIVGPSLEALGLSSPYSTLNFSRMSPCVLSSLRSRLIRRRT